MIMQKSKTAQLNQIVSSLETGVQLDAVVRSREQQAELRKTLVSLPLMPAFYVHTSEIHMNDLQPTAQLTITALAVIAESLRV